MKEIPLFDNAYSLILDKAYLCVHASFIVVNNGLTPEIVFLRFTDLNFMDAALDLTKLLKCSKLFSVLSNFGAGYLFFFNFYMQHYAYFRNVLN